MSLRTGTLVSGYVAVPICQFGGSWGQGDGANNRVGTCASDGSRRPLVAIEALSEASDEIFFAVS